MSHPFSFIETPEKISFFVHRPLQEAGFPNAFSTRSGGQSYGNGGLNFSFKHDNPDHVQKNRRAFLNAIKAPAASLITIRQIHSNKSVWVQNASEEETLPEADALATTQPQMFLGVKTADCLPILIGDPSSGVCAAIHAGWKGTSLQIINQTISFLKGKTTFNPKTALAALGPSACRDCYEIKKDVVEAFQGKPGQAGIFQTKEGAFRFDGGEANKAELLAAGLKENHIDRLKECTIHQENLFFSHRRDGGSAHPWKNGRLISVISKS